MNNLIIDRFGNDVKIDVEIIGTGPPGDKGDKGDPGEPGTTDYNELENRPRINSVELINNVTFPDLGMESIENSLIGNLF